jgi:hypothetical protein
VDGKKVALPDRTSGSLLQRPWNNRGFDNGLMSHQHVPSPNYESIENLRNIYNS